MSDCIFCKIANKEIKSDFVYENEHFFAINDINPKAPVHILLIPKQHIPTLNDLNDKNLAGELLSGIKEVAKKVGIKEYKTLINTGAGAGQEVFHLHIHILADKPNNN